ncbi:hypothetical protein [Sphingomonas sp. PR090111-T3T-6A]|uniref:hypothetical protein n=1 Tax=Sphingomonas sp. PR090111-T3T-6A TaxID=685778 RepID=UPI0003636DE4|nr:hypothetical protein [Sphingomonas sp. PR090111-T3T-6A]
MIEGVEAIGAVEPVALSVASALSTRQGVVRRERRLRWLKSLHAAQGGPALVDEESAAELEREEEERRLSDMRARLATAVSLVEAMGSLSRGPGEAMAESRDTITATELAQRIGAAGDQSLRAQARLGSAAVRQLVGWVR